MVGFLLGILQYGKRGGSVQGPAVNRSTVGGVIGYLLCLPRCEQEWNRL